MTVTISRLYDNRTDAERAVQRLEASACRIPILALSPIILIAGTRTTRSRIAIMTASMTVRKAPERVLALVPASAARPDFSPDSACSLFQAWAPLLLQVGWRRLPLAQRPVLLQADLSVHSLRQVYRRLMPTPTPREFAAAEPWCPRVSRKPIAVVLTRY